MSSKGCRVSSIEVKKGNVEKLLLEANLVVLGLVGNARPKKDGDFLVTRLVTSGCVTDWTLSSVLSSAKSCK